MVLNGSIKIGNKTYTNGVLPIGVRVPLSYAKNHTLYADAADAWNRVNADFKAKTGKNIDITDAYRAYSTQERIFKDRYRLGYVSGADNRQWKGRWYHRVKGAAAAVPGTSNHGLARAVDVNLGAQQYFGSYYYNTLKSVAAKHGFNNDVGRTINEPWHWEYEASKDVGKPKPKPKPKPVVRKNVTGLQAAVRAKQDNSWGADTDKRLAAVRAASALNGRKYPYGVKYVQAVLGVTQDGSFGGRTNAAHTAVVKKIQTWLKSNGYYTGKVDGNWGPGTDKAFVKARSANKR